MKERLRELFHRYERPASSLAMVVGFVVDSLTLRRVDLLVENLVLIGYLLIIATSIIFLNRMNKPHPIVLIAMQFSVGGLMSAFLVFYSRSGSIATSWFFLLVILGLMIGNEVLRDRYARLKYQITILFFTLFSYSIFLVPVILKQLTWWTFVLGGFLSLGIIAVFLYVLFRIVPIQFRESFKNIVINILFVYFLINILYFTNVIPPVPLSLEEAGIYSNISRNTDGSYNLTPIENISKFAFFGQKAINLPRGEELYLYSSIFAPTRLSTSIIHEWERYDDVSHEWVTQGKIGFPIYGGRDGGYRGYSIKSVTTGDWRVNIETSSGKMVGRIKFNVR